ncbi:MAG: hypothetical protein RMN53_16335, partial [Anaerolineae bacterium]|nr:hypothetical protein [Anaerolineae bacterium]
LRAVVQELAEAQKRTEQRVEELAEAQKRTEQRVEDLAEAQKRTEQRVEDLAEAQRQSEARLTRLETVVAELAEAQRQSEARLTRLETVVAELAEAQRQSEARLTRLETVVAELAEAQKRTEQRVEELAEAQKRTEQRVEELAEAQKRTEEAILQLTAEQREMKISLAVLQGERLERQFRDKAPAYFGRILRRTRALSLQELEVELEDRLDRDELQEVMLLDAVVRGRLPERGDAASVLLAVEASVVVDRNDVERAARRAALLRKAGLVAVPTAAGEKITQGAIEAARQAGVLLVQDGQQLYWDEALAAALEPQR